MKIRLFLFNPYSRWADRVSSELSVFTCGNMFDLATVVCFIYGLSAWTRAFDCFLFDFFFINWRQPFIPAVRQGGWNVPCAESNVREKRFTEWERNAHQCSSKKTDKQHEWISNNSFCFIFSRSCVRLIHYWAFSFLWKYKQIFLFYSFPIEKNILEKRVAGKMSIQQEWMRILFKGGNRLLQSPIDSRWTCG